MFLPIVFLGANMHQAEAPFFTSLWLFSSPLHKYVKLSCLRCVSVGPLFFCLGGTLNLAPLLSYFLLPGSYGSGSLSTPLGHLLTWLIWLFFCTCFVSPVRLWVHRRQRQCCESLSLSKETETRVQKPKEEGQGNAHTSDWDLKRSYARSKGEKVNKK